MAKRADGTGSVYKRGDRDGWYVAVRGPDGRQIRRKGGGTQREALAALKKLRAEVWNRPRDLDSRAALATFLVKDHIAMIGGRLSPAVAKLHGSRLRRIALYFGKKPMRSITRADAERCLVDLGRGWVSPAERKAAQERLEEKERKAAKREERDPVPVRWEPKRRSPATLRAYRSTASVCWADAETRGLVGRNVWKGIKLAKSQETPVPFLSEKDLAVLYGAMPERFRPAIVLLGETGIRRGELLGLEWRDVNLASEPPRLIVRASKSRRVRYVPLRPLAIAAIKVLRGRREDSLATGRVCESIGTTWHRDIREAWSAACEKLARGHLRVHDLRHARASLLVRAGVPMPTVAEWLGHADASLVAKRYGHHAPDNALELALKRSMGE